MTGQYVRGLAGSGMGAGLNAVVYEVYRLTEEEVAIMEGE